jgi:hypothetical protein
LGVGEEIADYAYSYLDSGTGAGTTVKTSTIFHYDEDGTMKEASAVINEGTLKTSDVYRLDIKTDPSNAKLAQEVYFTGDKGEEITNYAKYITTDGHAYMTAVFFYEGDKRAENADTSSALLRRDVYRLDAVDASGNVEDSARLVSKAYFDVHNGKGEEIADYQINYGGDGSQVISSTVYMYNGDQRAADSSYDDAMSKQITYKGEISDFDSVDSTDRINTIVYFGAQGEEKIDYIEDRKGVKHDYNYLNGELDYVEIVGNGTITKYTRNKFYEDQVDYTKDYKDVVTHYEYDPDTEILQKTWYEVEVADFDSTGFIGSKISREDTLFTLNEYYEPVAQCVMSSDGKLTYYGYSDQTKELSYTYQFEGVDTATINDLVAGTTDINTVLQSLSSGSITKAFYERNEFNENRVSMMRDSNGIWAFLIMKK